MDEVVRRMSRGEDLGAMVDYEVARAQRAVAHGMQTMENQQNSGNLSLGVLLMLGTGVPAWLIFYLVVKDLGWALAFQTLFDSSVDNSSFFWAMGLHLFFLSILIWMCIGNGAGKERRRAKRFMDVSAVIREWHSTGVPPAGVKLYLERHCDALVTEQTFMQFMHTRFPTPKAQGTQASRNTVGKKEDHAKPAHYRYKNGGS